MQKGKLQMKHTFWCHEAYVSLVNNMDAMAQQTTQL
jgi:hypothetical protein